jgi:hypothetical protein
MALIICLACAGLYAICFFSIRCDRTGPNARMAIHQPLWRAARPVRQPEYRTRSCLRLARKACFPADHT